MSTAPEWIEDDGEAVIAEVRAARHRISARFGHDPYKLVAHYIERQKENEARLIRAGENARPSSGSGNVAGHDEGCDCPPAEE